MLTCNSEPPDIGLCCTAPTADGSIVRSALRCEVLGSLKMQLCRVGQNDINLQGHKRVLEHACLNLELAKDNC